MDIQNKVALVTGASSGIGRATASELSKRGAKVAIAARTESDLQELAAQLPDSLVLIADLRNEQVARDVVKQVHEHYGQLDIIVNNAGRSYMSPIETIDTNLIREIYELNVFTPVAIMNEAYPLMKAQGRGSIVNVSSGTVFMVTPRISAYSSSKRALTGFSLAAREEFKSANIAVGTIYPYITDTDFFPDTLGQQGGHANDFTSGRAPADPPEYIADLICQLIESGDAEIYAHDWMKEGRPAAQKAQDRQLTD